eukprot:19681-Lingulodinium_polyedra.AAC.1
MRQPTRLQTLQHRANISSLHCPNAVPRKFKSRPYADHASRMTNGLLCQRHDGRQTDPGNR